MKQTENDLKNKLAISVKSGKKLALKSWVNTKRHHPRKNIPRIPLNLKSTLWKKYQLRCLILMRRGREVMQLTSCSACLHWSTVKHVFHIWTLIFIWNFPLIPKMTLVLWCLWQFWSKWNFNNLPYIPYKLLACEVFSLLLLILDQKDM